QIPAPNAANWITCVPFGSTWRFSSTTPPTNWFASGFNDLTWPMGLAKFGAGSGPTNIITRLPQILANYYFRKTFTLASTNVEELLLSATCTDLYAGVLCPLRVFLNGTEINSRIEAVSGQGNETLYFDLTPFAPLVRAGTNTIAVQVGNTWAADWDDVAFDVCLKAVFANPATTRLRVLRDQSNATQVQIEAPA